MFEETKLFGISMASRSNRRALVLITYLITAIVLAACFLLTRFVATIAGHSGLKLPLMFLGWVPVFLVQFVIPGSGRFRGIFGRFVREETFSLRPIPAVGPGLGLQSAVPGDVPESDERQVAVRNSAYFLAFRIVGWYSFTFFFAFLALMNRQTADAKEIAVIAAIPMVVMTFTLPQAIVLWTEPDLPVEDEG